MKKKILISVAAIFFIALNATVFTDVTKTSNVTLSSIIKEASAQGGMEELDPIYESPSDYECPVDEGELAGSNGSGTDCSGTGGASPCITVSC